MSLLKIPKSIQEQMREGLVRWALKKPDPIQDKICESICERVISTYPVIGFNTKGEALIECETIPEAVAVPDVAIIRTRDYVSPRGCNFHRVAFKFFKAD